MDEIAERAEVTKRTLYKHFPSKIALFIHMFDLKLRKLEAKLASETGEDDAPDTALRRKIKALFRFTRKNEAFMRLYWMIDSREFEGQIPQELIERINGLTKRMLDDNQAAVEKALAGGAIISVEPLFLVHLLSAINKGIFIHSNKEKRLEIADIGPDKLFDTLLKILDKGLFVKPAAGKKRKLT